RTGAAGGEARRAGRVHRGARRRRRRVQALPSARDRLMSAILARRYFIRGRDEMARGEYDAAVESFRAAVALVPGFGPGRVRYAAALARIGAMPPAAQAPRAGLP